MDKELKRALLIFAKRPLSGSVKTRLVPPFTAGEAASLYCCMLRDVLAKVETLTDCACYLFYGEGPGARDYFRETVPGMECLPQQGGDLGERMAAAFGHAFAMGHGTAVVIGTDSPDLPLSFIEAAFGRLEAGEGRVVLGPSEDGGYYLLGMTCLHAELFRDVPWSSGEVLLESLRRAEEAGIAVSLLPVWHDVDTAADLERPELIEEWNGAPRTRAFLKGYFKTSSS
jgi:uncharacterized protein